MTRQTVLVVDDAPANLAVVHSILKDRYRILAAASPSRALEMARTQLPQLILLDVAMPEMDGYEVCRELQANPATRAIPIIFLTGQTEAEQEAYAFECGGCDVIHKPVDPSVLKARVRNGLARADLSNLVMDSISEQIAVVDRSGLITAVNRSWNACPANVGCNSAGASYLEFLSQTNQAEAAAILTGVEGILSGQAEEFQIEYRCNLSDGSPRWCRLRANRLQDGRPGMLVMKRDITAERMAALGTLELETRRAEALLQLPQAAEKLSERPFLQAALESLESLTASPCSFVHFPDDQAGSALQWSGRSRSFLEGRKPLSLPRLEALDQPLILNQAVDELQRAILVPVLQDGRLVMVAGVTHKASDYEESDLQTVRLVANEIWRLVERSRTHEQLLKLSRAVEQSPNSIVITNLAGDIEYVNQAFEAVSGYSASEVLGKNPRVLKSGETPPERFQEMWTNLRQGKVWQGELRNRRKDGSFYTEWAILSPIRRSDGRVSHYVGIKEDITERMALAQELEQHRHHLEELVATRTFELAQARQRAESANRAKSAFLANMSHEIRTPLNAIIGLTHLLRRSGVSAQQIKRLDAIDSAGRHLLEVISDILDLAKIEAGRFEIEAVEFHLSALLDNVSSLTGGQAQAQGLRLAVECDESCGWVKGDVTRIRQALLNYVSNALKFTQSGQITLRCKIVTEHQDSLVAAFEVEDTGAGIPPENLPRLFQTFEQLDASTTRKHGGTGLGLAITRRLAELMGGSAEVESVPGQGSLFRFTVPLQRATGPARMASRGPEGDVEQLLSDGYRGRRLLLVEDNPINREVATEMLHAVGLLVDTAEDGEVAVQLAAASHYDLILMDLQMPGLDGLEATRRIRLLPGQMRVPILAMTANVFEEDRQECLRSGMDDFVPKPVDPQNLYLKVLRWLSRQPLKAESSHSLRYAQPDWLPDLPGCQMQRGLMVVHGDAHKYLRLLTELVHSSLSEIRELDPTRPEAMRRQAHKIKGAAANLGAEKLAQLSTSLEMGAESLVDFAPLTLALNELAEALPVLPEPRRPVSASSCEPIRVELCRLLQAGDAEAVTLFESNLGAFRLLLGESYAEFSRSVEHFEFDRALKIIQSLLPRIH